MSRGMSEENASRYFDAEGHVSVLTNRIRKRVRFRHFNLQDDFRALGRFDMILMRNVAIYFSSDFKRDLFSRMASALYPGGCLFLGSAESVLGYSTEFDMQDEDRAICYVPRQEARPKVGGLTGAIDNQL